MDENNEKKTKEVKKPRHEKLTPKEQDDYLHVMWEQNKYCKLKGGLLFLCSLIFFGTLLELYYLPKYADISSASTIWNGFSFDQYYDDMATTLVFWFLGLLSVLLMMMGIKIFNKGSK